MEVEYEKGSHQSKKSVMNSLAFLAVVTLCVYVSVWMFDLRARLEIVKEKEEYKVLNQELDGIYVGTAFRTNLRLDTFFQLTPDQQREVDHALEFERNQMNAVYWHEIHNCSKNLRVAARTIGRREAKVRPIFESAAREYGLPVELLLGMGKRESMFCTNFVSSDEAWGMMQFIPSTARIYGISDPRDIVASVRAAARYIRSEIDWFKNSKNLARFCKRGVNSCRGVKRVRVMIREGSIFKLAVQTYHAGRTNVMNGTRLGRENRNYVRFVMQYYNEYRRRGA